MKRIEVRSWEQWLEDDMRVMCGQKAQYVDIDGTPLFTRDQVVYRPEKDDNKISGKSFDKYIVDECQDSWSIKYGSDGYWGYFPRTWGKSWNVSYDK